MKRRRYIIRMYSGLLFDLDGTLVEATPGVRGRAKMHDAPAVAVDSIPSVIASLSEVCRLAVVTAAPLPYAIRTLKKTGLWSFFQSCIIACEHTRRQKPSPEPLYLATKRLGMVANECAFIGDSLNDLCAARAAGTTFYLADWSRKGPLFDLQKSHILTRPEDLVRLYSPATTM